MSTVKKKSKDIRPISKERILELQNLSDKDINYSDIEDISKNKDFWAKAKLVYPVSTVPVTLRLEEDVLE
jgi:uncharacterized protein (DUF4415 family)